MKRFVFISGFISNLLTLVTILPAFSQINSDNTTNTTVVGAGNNFNILNVFQEVIIDFIKIEGCWKLTTNISVKLGNHKSERLQDL